MAKHTETDMSELNGLLNSIKGNGTFGPLALTAGIRRQALLKALAERRRELNLSQGAVASAMRTSQAAIARLESGGADPKISTIERYAAVLGSRIEATIADDSEAAEAYAGLRDRSTGRILHETAPDDKPWRHFVPYRDKSSEDELKAAVLSDDPSLAPRAAFLLAGVLAENGDLTGAEDLYRKAWESEQPELTAKAALVVGALSEQRDAVDLARDAYEWAAESDDPAVTLKARVALERLNSVVA